MTVVARITFGMIDGLRFRKQLSHTTTVIYVMQDTRERRR
jgi:hypothetical protein